MPDIIGFDADEFRKRRTLAQAMEADPQLKPPELRPLTPEEQRFNELAANAPVEEDYRPSTLRNILAAVAGFGMGMYKDPAAGMNMTDQIRRQPFMRAQQTYERNLSNAQNAMVIDQQRRAEAQKQQALNSDSENARANLVRARSGVEWRPQTEEEATNFAVAKMPPRTRTSEELAQDFFRADPKGFAEYMRLKNSRPGSLSLEDRMKLADYEGQIHRKNALYGSGLRMSEQTHAAELRPVQSESPVSETQRQRMAIENILRNNPQFKDYVAWSGSTSWSPGSWGQPKGDGYWRIKRPDEVKGVFRRWTPEDSVRYKKFQNAVALEMENLRSIGRSTSGGAGYYVEPADDEEGEQ